ncbi:hypothetical protein SDC9_61507 [bioreactor metagenome]|uniref:Uncharacterized protein n=1 Tax=bioreactor metagenome TaxID=1076179 RepID=A0A644XH86_9ZZZZ
MNQIPQSPVHGECTSGKGISFPGHGVSDGDIFRAQTVEPVRHSGGFHGIGTKITTFGAFRAANQPNDDRINMDEIRDKLRFDAIVGERNPEDARIAVMEREHPVAGVSGAAYAERDCPRGFLRRGRRMSDGGNDPPAAEIGDQFHPTGELGSQRNPDNLIFKAGYQA